MNTFLISAISAVVIIGGAIFFLWQRSNKKTKFRVGTKPILTSSETEMFKRLCTALPAFYIFPKVAIATMLSPKSSKLKSKNAEFNKVAQKTVDFAICDADLTLICIVDLEAQGGNTIANALSDQYFKSAGIKTIRWDSEAKPTIEQISKKILPLLTQEKTRSGSDKKDPMDTVLMMYRNDPEPSNIPGLTFAILDKLTPNKVLLNTYPHIWQRICVFAIEPKHLQKYLISLSLQDRGEKRAGFTLEALKEVADIQIENDRFLSKPVSGWQPAIVNI